MRRNRRKRAERRPLRLPRIRINVRAWLLTPLIGAAVLAGCAGTRILLDKPLATLILEGRFQRVTPVQVEAALADEASRGFLSVDLEELVHRLESLDWIDHVEIERRWPDALVVRFSEHQAAARWGESGLLNVRGELFTENVQIAFPELPQLSGPPGSEREVGRLYLAIRGRLIEAGLALESLSLDERGAWRLRLTSGQEIRLGQQDVTTRLARLFDVAVPGLAQRMSQVAYIDLRYTNGFAVGWTPEAQSEIAVMAHEGNSRG